MTTEPSGHRVPVRSRWWRAVRWVPFVAVAAASVWAAGRAPSGRRPPEFDWTVTGTVAVRALGKGPHIVYMLLLFLLALLALLAVGGARRAWAAAILTLAVGALWEVAETTVVGQHPRLIDLLPDLVGIGLGWLVVLAASAVIRARSRRVVSR